MGGVEITSGMIVTTVIAAGLFALGVYVLFTLKR